MHNHEDKGVGISLLGWSEHVRQTFPLILITLAFDIPQRCVKADATLELRRRGKTSFLQLVWRINSAVTDNCGR